MINNDNYIEKLKKRNERAIDYIIEKYIPLVKGISKNVLEVFKDKGLIEECVNDVFLNVWKYGKSFEGEEADFKYWIAKITKMKAIDYYRKRIKRIEDVEEQVEIKEKYFLEEEVIERESKTKLYKILGSLKSEDREIFTMKYFLGMKSSEIAKKKNLSETAINNRLFRTKKKVKASYLNEINCEG